MRKISPEEKEPNEKKKAWNTQVIAIRKQVREPKIILHGLRIVIAPDHGLEFS